MGCDEHRWERKPVPPAGRSRAAPMKKSHLSSLRSEPHTEPQEEVGLMTYTGFLRQGSLSSLPWCSLLPVPLGLGLELPGPDEGVHLQGPGSWPSTVPQRGSCDYKFGSVLQANHPLQCCHPEWRVRLKAPYLHSFSPSETQHHLLGATSTENHIPNRGRPGPWCHQNTVDFKTD